MISIIVPTYKEARNIESLVGRVKTSLSGSKYAYEIIIVDDNSRDGIEDIIRKLRDENHPVQLIIRREERGLGSAVLRGVLAARGNIFVCMDADLSHPPEAIVTLVSCFDDNDCEFAIGSRYVAGGSTDTEWGAMRWLNSKVATLLARPFTCVKDPMSGFFAVPRRIFDRAEKLCPIGYKIGLELIVKCRCKNVREIPIHFAKRRYGQSKMNLREQVDYLKHLKRLADFRFGVLSRFLQFCIVGLSGMIIDITTYAALLTWGSSMYVGRGIAILGAMTWNFFFNRKFTFSDCRSGPLFRQYLGFIASSAVGALISWTVSTIIAPMSSFFRQHLLLSAVVGILAGTASNFMMCRRFVFQVRRKLARQVLMTGDGSNRARNFESECGEVQQTVLAGKHSRGAKSYTKDSEKDSPSRGEVGDK